MGDHTRCDAHDEVICDVCGHNTTKLYGVPDALEVRQPGPLMVHQFTVSDAGTSHEAFIVHDDRSEAEAQVRRRWPSFKVEFYCSHDVALGVLFAAPVRGDVPA